MQTLKTAILSHLAQDRITFWVEMIGVIFTIVASLTLALSAKDPNMVIIFPLYQVGSISLLYAYYRRKMIWSVVLTFYFVIINTVGFIIALQ